ncbi:MAG: DUF6298 domain-containing protein [Capsulimonadales bacterium]|nr:DUF6298 domain-containing protein [Capsulimonadales bacterium]
MPNPAVFQGPLRRNPANPRYFTDDTGKAIYLTGSHTWAVMQDMWLENGPRHNTDYTGFLDMLTGNGHNFLRFWQWMQTRRAAWSDIPTIFDPQPFARTGNGTARDGLPKFDLAVWNDAYFDRLCDRVDRAAERGIYVSIMLFEGWAIKWASPQNDPWPFHPMHPENNVNGITDDPVVENGRAWDFYSMNCPQLRHWQERYVRKTVETLNDRDNVLFEVCNEVPHRREAMDWSEHIVRVIRDCEASLPKRHPVGITAEGGDHNNEELFATNADWISPSNGRLFEYRYHPPAADGSKVVLNDTDHLWGHGAEIDWIWKSFTRGMNVLFMDPWEPIPNDMPGWVKNGASLNTRHYHLWDAVRRNLGYARQYADRMDLNRCLPHNGLCTSTYCLADPGTEYLFFLPSGGSQGIDLWDAPGNFVGEWRNILTGEVFPVDGLTGGRRHVIGAPFSGSAALYLKRRNTDD